MTIITFEIVNNYRQGTPSFGYSIQEITHIVSSTRIVACNVTMVSCFIIFKRFYASMTGGGSGKQLRLCSGKQHWFWSSNIFVK